MTASVSNAKIEEHLIVLDELWEAFSKRDRDWCKYEDYDGSYGTIADDLEDVARTLRKIKASTE